MQNTQFHGNTFLFINKNASEFSLPAESKQADLTMYYLQKSKSTLNKLTEFDCTFFNKDGSEANLCCNALFALMKQEGEGSYAFNTNAGKIHGANKIGMSPYNKEVPILVLEMPKTEIKRLKQTITVDNCEYDKMDNSEGFEVNIGNRHIILPLSYYQDYHSSSVSTQYNLHFYQHKKNEGLDGIFADFFNSDTSKTVSAEYFQVRCFEKGVGGTQSCGSGAYAVGVAMMKHFGKATVKIQMKGGSYQVQDGLLIVKI